MTDDQFEALNRRFDKMEHRMDRQFETIREDIHTIKTLLRVAKIDTDMFRSAVFTNEKP